MQFNNQALILRKFRILKGFTQEKLGQEIGFKNGQFVSNIERGLCGIPDKYLKQLISMGMSKEEVIESISKDVREYLESL